MLYGLISNTIPTTCLFTEALALQHFCVCVPHTVHLMSAMSAVLRCEGPRIALYIEDKSPFSSVNSSTRCLTHFMKYIIDDNRWMEDLCSACSCIIECGVVSHTHSTSAFGEALITYYGENEDGYCASYMWVPEYNIVLCSNCSESTERSINIVRWRQDEMHDSWSHCCFR